MYATNNKLGIANTKYEIQFYFNRFFQQRSVEYFSELNFLLSSLNVQLDHKSKIIIYTSINIYFKCFLRRFKFKKKEKKKSAQILHFTIR